MSDATPEQLWAWTHHARKALAADLRGIDDAAWRAPSLCGDWDVEHVVAHLTAAASVGRLRWIRSIVASGFRPDVHNDRRLREHLGATPPQTLHRFEAVADSTVAPTGDLAAYLGEVLGHGQDIRVPLGIATEPTVEPLTAVARFYAQRDFTVNSKTLTTGLRLRATDGPFEAGDGPEVSGPTSALVMTMAGRTAYLERLTGPGVATLTERLR